MTGVDPVRVTTVVAVDVDAAFEVFTREVDAWWRRGPRFRAFPGDGGCVRFEPGRGGRFLEEDADGVVFEIGRVHVWEPPSRLVFGFRNRDLAPDASTEVEVRFEPCSQGARVTVEHRGWDALAPDHPARLALDATALRGTLQLWWSDQLTALRGRPAAG